MLIRIKGYDLMNKVIYFDEIAATDYVDIKNGGRKNIENNYIITLAGKIGAEMQAGASIPSIFQQFLNLGAGASTEASILSNNMIKTFISNTILTDFLNVISDTKDNDIKTFNNPKLKAYENSMAFLKMYAPYMKMLNSKELIINLSEIDSVLQDAKGYYELIAQIDNKIKVILRFNITAFRNNYGLTDIIKMNLNYYAIKVGSYPENMLDITKEFSLLPEEPDAYQINPSSNDSNQQSTLLDVYDVILAGVEN